MNSRSKIALYFLTFLPVFLFNTYSPCFVLATDNNANSYNTVVLTHHNAGKVCLDLKKSVVKTDWIKVRYMGGECRYDSALFPIVLISQCYTDQISGSGYTSCISLSTHVLFKLRGPPQPIA